MKVRVGIGFRQTALGWRLPLAIAVVILLFGNATAAAAFGYALAARPLPLLEVGGVVMSSGHALAAAGVAMVLLKISVALGAAELFRADHRVRGLAALSASILLVAWSSNATAVTLAQALDASVQSTSKLAVLGSVGIAIEFGGLLGLLVLLTTQQRTGSVDPSGPSDGPAPFIDRDVGTVDLRSPGPENGTAPMSSAEASDLIARWASSSIAAARDARIGASEAYEAFLFWSARSGKRVAVSQRRFAATFVSHLGLVRERSGPRGQIVYRGASFAGASDVEL